MKNAKKVLALMLALSIALVPAVFASADAAYVPGTYSCTEKGFGGDVTVTMTFDESSITDVQIVGDNETPGIGMRAVETLPQAMLDAQSADVDGITGATGSSTAILKAARACVAQASGAEAAAEIKLVPGTYTGSAIGYFKLNPVTVDVTVDEKGITDVVIEDTSDETYGMLVSIRKNLLPRMVEYNSVTIDSITGATATSVAVKAAAAQAMDQALADAGYANLKAVDVFDGKVPQKNETVTLDCDVLVIGLGGSGSTALASATQNGEGLSVIAVEKAGLYGGTSQMTCDVFAMNPAGFIAEHNNGEPYQDPKPMYDTWLEYTTNDKGEQKAKVEMIDLLFNESGTTVDWLIDYCGYKFNEPVGGFTAADNFLTKYQYSGGYAMDTRIETSNYFKGICEKAEANGAQIYYETEATELIADENGNVCGAKAVNLVDGTQYIINAKAVIDATGGFAGNDEMMVKYINSEFFCFDKPCGVVGSLQNDGKIMQSAIDLGAAVYNMNMPPEWHNAATPVLLSSQPVIAAPEGDTHSMFLPQAYSLNDLPTILGSSGNVLQVNGYGQRFDDETIKFRDAESGSVFYGIQTEANLKSIQEKGLTNQRTAAFVNIGGWYLNQPIPEVFDIVDECIELGICYKADTLEELAEKVGMPADALVATVARYNELCEKGVDEDFGKTAELMQPVAEEGPYYAFAVQEYIYNTLGGLDINEQMQVLNTEGNVIPGLYSVGNEVTGVLFTNEKVYMTYGGLDMSWCYTSGRLAGAYATDYARSLA